MAQVKFIKTSNASLASLPIVEGQLIFVQDTGALYIDKDSSNRVQIDGVAYTGSNGVSVNGKSITNSGVRSISTGSSNGTISVNTNGTAADVAVKGLGALAYKESLTASDVGLGNVGNFKAVSTVANQGLTSTEQSNARANIGAGTSSLTLGTGSSNAYRGDYGNTAYTHATDSNRLTTAKDSGLYKIATTAEGHIKSATAVVKSDITALGIPGNAIPEVFGTNSIGKTAGNITEVKKYGEVLRNGALIGANILNLGVNRFYRCFTNNATITCNYTNIYGSITNTFVDGSYNGYWPNINPSTMFTNKPFILEITRPTYFEYTDVCGLLLLGHRLYYSLLATKYKIEVAYAYDGSNYSWATVIDYNGAAVDLCQKYYGLYCSSTGISKYHPVYGIRLTISESTSTEFALAEVQLYCGRGTEEPYEAIHAMPDKGGTFTGDVTAPTFIGNLTGTATKATGDKNGNDITTTYYLASNPNGYTSNTGTITKVQANGTDVASSGTANIPAASTSVYGVTKLSNATDSTSEELAATPKAIKAAYDLAASKGTGTITGVSVNGTSVATSGTANITSVPASILSGAIPSAVTATTQEQNDNSTKIATTAYVRTAIDNLPEPMVFKGSLGTGGTITSLPAASASNEGYTYKVITDGTYASQAAKVGDMFISNGSSWVLIPSGDETGGTGTVTSVKISATSPIAIDNDAAITTSGTRTISHANSGATAGSYGDSAAQTPGYGSTFKVPYITVNATGHVTGISEHTVKIPASDNTNTTYTLTQDGSDGHKITLTPSSGSATTLTIPDNNTTYSLSADTTNNQIKLTPSSGSAQSVTVPYATNAGNASTATKLAASKTIALGTGVTGTATAFDGSGNITIPVTDVKDSYVTWGGKTIAGNISPDDMGCTDEFGHNKLAYLPASCIKAEYTTNGGSSWQDYGLSDDQKIALVTTSGPTVAIGKGTASASAGTMTNANCGNYQARVTISTRDSSGTGRLYTASKKWLINFSSNGAGGAKVKLEYRTIANYNAGNDIWTTQGTYDISGWSGWNSYPAGSPFGGGSTQTSQIADYRFTLTISSVNTSYTCTAGFIDFRLIGSTNWTMPSELARAGHLYYIDTAQNAAFPGNIRPTNNNSKTLGTTDYKWNNVYATTFTGNLTGTATKATGDKNGDDITTTYYKASNPSGYTSNTGTITGITMNGSSKGTSGVVDLGTVATTDTKNTAGTSNTTSKIFLAGATEQSTNPQTYSNVNCYASGGKLYSNAKEVVTLSDSQALTNKTYNGYTLAGACAKAVDTSISAGSTSTNLPTSAAVAALTPVVYSGSGAPSSGTGKNGDIYLRTDATSEIVNIVYPINSIYISVSSANPNTVFPGTTWVQITDKFLLAAGSTYSGGSTGGSATHTHTLDSGYAMIQHSNSKFWFAEKSTDPEWTDTGKTTTNVSGASSSTTNNEGTKLGGTTDSASSLPPYIAVYVWKRTA